MCGIGAIMIRNGEGAIGSYIIDVLRALQHRGRDSTGVAIYGRHGQHLYRVRIIARDVIGAMSKITSAIASVGGNIRDVVLNTSIIKGYSYDLYEIEYNGDVRNLIDAIESTNMAKVVSVGRNVDVIKHVASVDEFDSIFSISSIYGTHAIGHVRFSTESTVDILHAHPFQDLINIDFTLVHNGQITNYWKIRALLEMKGVRFASENDSELIVHYISHKISSGHSLEEALRESIYELDGPFAYIVATPNEIGLARDPLGLRPLVIGVSDNIFVAASEEGAIQTLENRYGVSFSKRFLRPGEVVVWRRN